MVKIKEPVRIRTKKIADGNESIFLDVYVDGKRRREYLKLYLIPEKSKADKEKNRKILELANAVKATRIVAIQNNQYDFNGSSKKAKINLVTYIRGIADEELAKSGNKRSYYYTLNSLANHLEIYKGSNTLLSHVDKKFVKGFIVYLRTAKNLNYNKSKKKPADDILSPNTQHNLYKKFAYIVKKAIIAELITTNPLDKIENSDKPKGEKGKREFLTIDEIKKLMHTKCKDDMVKRAFLFCCLTGLRYSDVKKLAWQDLYTDSDGSHTIRIRITKTKQYEDFPISDAALKLLSDRIEDDQPIFDLPKNDNANTTLKKWVKAAGINRKITFHCSRHTAATLNLSLGVPIETVSKLLGHTKITTTQIYAKIIDEKKKEAVNKQNGIFD